MQLVLHQGSHSGTESSIYIFLGVLGCAALEKLVTQRL